MKSTPHALPITIDKSFAQGVSASVLAELGTHWVLMVPSAFFWEIFTTTPVKLRRSVEGMPEFRMVDLSALQRIEVETGGPVVAVDTPRLQFSGDLRGGTWSPNAAQASGLDQYWKERVEPAVNVWNQVISEKSVIGFSADEMLAVGGTEEAFESLCAKLNEIERVRFIASEIGFAHAAAIDQRWLHFRLFQAWMLHGLVLLRRYRHLGSGTPSEERMEHDVQDIEYLVLGLHTNALATGDASRKLKKASMAWRFKLLDPAGVLMLPKQ